MRKSFPVPKGLRSPSFADRYAANRKNRSPKASPKNEKSRRFLASGKKLDLSGTSIKTSRNGWSLLVLIFLVSLVLGILIIATN